MGESWQEFVSPNGDPLWVRPGKVAGVTIGRSPSGPDALMLMFESMPPVVVQDTPSARQLLDLPMVTRSVPVPFLRPS